MTTFDEMTFRVPGPRSGQRRPLGDHVHEWHLVAEETDLYGSVREYACNGCDEVHFA